MNNQKGLKAFLKERPLELPAYYRLAFRELGLSTGIHAVEKLKRTIEQSPGFFNKNLLDAKLETVASYMPSSKQIETFWLYRSNQESRNRATHREINMVMLATSLAPDAYLELYLPQ